MCPLAIRCLSAWLLLFAAASVAEAQDRYGGGGSAIDYSKLFDETAPRSGGSSYRNSGAAAAPAAVPTNAAPKQPAPRTPSNTLRGPASQPPKPRVAVSPQPAARSRTSSARSVPSSAYGTPPAVTAGVSDRPTRRLNGEGYGQLSDPLAGGRPDRRPMTLDPRAGIRERQTRELLVELTRRPASSQLSGSPRSLASVIASAATRDQQTRLVEAYWSLFSASADYYLGLYELDELERLSNGTTTYSQPVTEARAALGTRISTALKAARAAQYRLGRMIGDGSMPLTTDVPFTGPYATRIDQIFPGGGPDEARLLDELIPLRLAELYSSADAVGRSKAWLREVMNARNARSDGPGIVRALELLGLNGRAFVQLARDYNLQINRYARLAAPGQVDTGLLVGMLVRTPGGSRFGTPTIASEAPLRGAGDFR
ncbi:MAG: hypothetical protein AAF805_10295 [Planctomycetota bacterium]